MGSPNRPGIILEDLAQDLMTRVGQVVLITEDRPTSIKLELTDRTPVQPYLSGCWLSHSCRRTDDIGESAAIPGSPFRHPVDILLDRAGHQLCAPYEELASRTSGE